MSRERRIIFGVGYVSDVTQQAENSVRSRRNLGKCLIALECNVCMNHLVCTYGFVKYFDCPMNLLRDQRDLNRDKKVFFYDTAPVIEP